MSSVTLTIEPANIHLLFDLFEEDTFVHAKEREIPGGAVIRYAGLGMQKRSFPTEADVLTLVLSLPVGVVSSLAATWLWEKFHEHQTGKITAIRHTFDERGIEVFETFRVETSPEGLAEIINRVLERQSDLI
jgi:hypothetical protein